MRNESHSEDRGFDIGEVGEQPESISWTQTQTCAPFCCVEFAVLVPQGQQSLDAQENKESDTRIFQDVVGGLRMSEDFRKPDPGSRAPYDQPAAIAEDGDEGGALAADNRLAQDHSHALSGNDGKEKSC